jgi:hypothetical protein
LSIPNIEQKALHFRSYGGRFYIFKQCPQVIFHDSLQISQTSVVQIILPYRILCHMIINPLNQSSLLGDMEQVKVQLTRKIADGYIIPLRLHNLVAVMTDADGWVWRFRRCCT